ncbi:MAG: integration host factor subunit beta [Candidatus Brocadiae bacterium]|nr:integration host factor subunit beta [Candidatus Brocadiia bacterium]
MANRTITKRELCERIAKKTGYAQVVTKEVIQLFLDEITAELAKGNRMEFRNFGVFDTRLQPARKARNPRTDEVVEVPPKAVVSFKVGKNMQKKAQAVLSILQQTP